MQVGKDYPQEVSEVEGVRDVGEYDVHDGEVEEEEAVRHATQGAERLPRKELVDHACNERGELQIDSF